MVTTFYFCRMCLHWLLDLDGLIVTRLVGLGCTYLTDLVEQAYTWLVLQQPVCTILGGWKDMVGPVYDWIQ